MATLVLSVIGDDRPGIVDALAAEIVRHGGNWDRSHLARLAGTFAGIVVVTVADDRTDALAGALEALRGVTDVRVAVAGDDGPPPHTELVRLRLIGQDRPGIVSEIAGALAARHVSIDELETSASPAPMSSEMLFEATATLRVPPTADVADVRAALEDIANELMVDLDVDAPSATESGTTASATTESETTASERG